jgi:hypothetical protein
MYDSNNHLDMAGTANVKEQDVPTPTVAACAESCLNSFQRCLNQAAAIHARELSLVEDQLARLSLWCSNISVFALGRGSLDHRLREAPDVQDAISGVLEALDYRLHGCVYILAPKPWVSILISLALILLQAHVSSTLLHQLHLMDK